MNIIVPPENARPSQYASIKFEFHIVIVVTVCTRTVYSPRMPNIYYPVVNNYPAVMSFHELVCTRGMRAKCVNN